jgi:putative sigma-54 modulation protein
MRLELTGRHVTITPALRKSVEKQLAPTLRMLNDNAVSTQVVLTREKARYRAEVTLHARGEHFMHGNGLGRDVATALAAAFDKITRQAERLKGKWDARRRRAAPRTIVAEPAVAADVQEVRIIRARRYAVKPMSVDEAALEVAGGRDAFLVFRSTGDDTIKVLFRRPDGNLGLIEPEA